MTRTEKTEVGLFCLVMIVGLPAMIFAGRWIVG